MNKTMRFLMLISLTAFFCASCMHQKPEIQTEADTTVILLNSDLQRTVNVDRDIRLEKDSNGVPGIHVKIKNITPQEILHLQAQTIWSDEKGRILLQDSPWQTLALTPGQAVTYDNFALNATASKYVVRIRYLVLSAIPSKPKK